MLLNRGANINAANQCGITALHNAVRSKKMEIIELLLKKGAYVNARDSYSVTPLHLAVDNGSEEIVKLLLSHGAYVNSVCDYSFGEGHTVWLGVKETSTSLEGCTPLCLAVRKGHEEVVKLLLESGANVNAQDETGEPPIFHAVQNVDLKITKLLLTNKANIKNNPELLNIAVLNGCREIVEVLLEHGADVNTTDECGRMALHFTGSYKTREFDAVGLSRDPDITVKREIAKLLLSRGANVNTQTENGATTLHVASGTGYVKVVEALLQYNANINSKNITDITPLHIPVALVILKLSSYY